MKYIVFENIATKLRQREVVMFPDAIVHSSVMIKPDRESHYVWRAISAGMFRYSFSDGGVNTYGESESLRLKPHAEDERIIEDRITNGTQLFIGDRK